MATFTEDFTRMRHDFDQSQEDRQRLFEDTRGHVQQMACDMQEQLAGFRHGFEQMRGEIAETADQVRTELRGFGADLRTGGRVFRKQSKPR
jgi:hypothetical protein